MGLMHGDLDMACLSFLFHTIGATFCGWNLEKVMSLAAENTRRFSGWDQKQYVLFSSMEVQSLGKLIPDCSESDHWSFQSRNDFSNLIFFFRLMTKIRVTFLSREMLGHVFSSIRPMIFLLSE